MNNLVCEGLFGSEIKRLTVTADVVIEHAPIEIPFGFESLFKILCLSKAMAFTCKGEVCNRNTFVFKGSHHVLGLVGWYHLVIQSLKQYDRTVDPIDRMDWRAGLVYRLAFRIWPYQTIM